MSLQVLGKFIADIFEQEEPSGTVDGINDDFVLSSPPHSAKSTIVFLNGRVQAQGTDYTISSSTITFTIPPEEGQVVYCFYIKL